MFAVVRRLVPSSLHWTLFQALLTIGPFYDLYCVTRERHREQRVSRSTDLVLAGFPRSANSFAHVIFRKAAGPDARIASHLHVPIMARRAVRYGIPCVLLIREPDGTTRSGLTAAPELSAAALYRHYARYHEALLRLAPRLLVVDFARMTDDPAGVVHDVNARYGTTLDEELVASLEQEQVFAELDGYAANAQPDTQVSAITGRPVAGRHDAVRIDFDDPEVARWRARAIRVHEQIVGAGVPTPGVAAEES